MIATEPLSDRELEPIGWKGFEGVEDARNLIHYYRLTPDKRLVMGGGPVGLTWANTLDADSNEAAWKHLECPFVNRRVIPWPPEPLRMLTIGSLRGYLQVEDRLYERKLPQEGR